MAACQALPPLSQAERFSYTHKNTLQAGEAQPSLRWVLPIRQIWESEAAFIFFTERKEQGRPMPLCAMVLGAGRGPLVEATLKAAERAEVEVELYAVEKNPNAVHALRHRKRRDGWTAVQVVPGDMRSWTAPKKADVIISELLGSFGDNELSPECLDGKDFRVLLHCKFASKCRAQLRNHPIFNLIDTIETEYCFGMGLNQSQAFMKDFLRHCVEYSAHFKDNLSSTLLSFRCRKGSWHANTS
eukprot:Skav226496  [mRNA]  locus=scaffold4305:33266:51540:+ [translate_table: standard]